MASAAETKLRSVASEVESAAVTQQYKSDRCLGAIEFLLQWIGGRRSDKIPEETTKILKETELLTHLVSIFTEETSCQLDMEFVDNSCLEKVLLKLISDISKILAGLAAESAEISVQISRSAKFLRCQARVLKQLRSEHLNQSVEKDVNAFLLNSIKLCYNLARHDETEISNRIRDAKMLPELEPYLKSHDEDFRALAMLLLVYLVDEEEAEKYADEEALRYLLMAAKKGIEDRSTSVSRVFLMCDILNALSKLSELDAYKRKLGDLGVIDVMKDLIQSEDNSHAEIALNILWQLAFVEENSKRIREANLDALIKPFTDTSKSLGLEKEARGILWTMGEATGQCRHGKEEKKVAASQSSPPSQPAAGGPAGLHIMISYQWDNQPMVVRLKNFLESKGYKLWVDIESIGPSLYDSMADAVERSWLVLICFSKKYKESQNTRLEAEYAVHRRKAIIPLKMDDFSPDGWLGLLIAGKLYYDFSGSVAFEQKALELVSGIEKVKGSTP